MPHFFDEKLIIVFLLFAATMIIGISIMATGVWYWVKEFLKKMRG